MAPGKIHGNRMIGKRIPENRYADFGCCCGQASFRMRRLFIHPQPELIIKLPACGSLSFKRMMPLSDKSANDFILGFKGFFFPDADVINAGIAVFSEQIIIALRMNGFDGQIKGKMKIMIDLRAGGTDHINKSCLQKRNHHSAHAPGNACAGNAEPDRVVFTDHPSEKFRAPVNIPGFKAGLSHILNQFRYRHLLSERLRDNIRRIAKQ